MSLARERMLALLATFFGALALLLACIFGLYGVMAYRVARRTREIGIRIAVGAGQRSVVWMMVRETLLLVTIGAALGTLALAGRDPLRRRSVVRRDAARSCGDRRCPGWCSRALTLLAGYLPARQASRIDPVRALRAHSALTRRGIRTREIQPFSRPAFFLERKPWHL